MLPKGKSSSPPRLILDRKGLDGEMPSHERRSSAGQQAGRRHRPRPRPRSGAGTILNSPIHPDHIFRHQHRPDVHSSRGVRFRHAHAVARCPLKPTAEPRAMRKERCHRRTHALPATMADAPMRMNARLKPAISRSARAARSCGNTTRADVPPICRRKGVGGPALVPALRGRPRAAPRVTGSRRGMRRRSSHPRGWRQSQGVPRAVG